MQRPFTLIQVLYEYGLAANHNESGGAHTSTVTNSYILKVVSTWT